MRRWRAAAESYAIEGRRGLARVVGGASLGSAQRIARGARGAGRFWTAWPSRRRADGANRIGAGGLAGACEGGRQRSCVLSSGGDGFVGCQA